jgi:hypothetical protein
VRVQNLLSSVKKGLAYSNMLGSRFLKSNVRVRVSGSEY